jgi:phospholipase/lecithinase/hemolysin
VKPGGGGTNYAAGGAQNNANFVNPNAPSTVSQITSYLSAHGSVADPNALCLFSSGGNDIIYASSLVGNAKTGWLASAATAAATALLNLQNADGKLFGRLKFVLASIIHCIDDEIVECNRSR